LELEREEREGTVGCPGFEAREGVMNLRMIIEKTGDLGFFFLHIM
jgi:hypothetical protein